MTDTQKKCFLAVSEHLSFSKAASVLYVSQPAVSKNITSLENELGASLFLRQGKVIELSPAGEIFRDFLREYDREYNTTIQRIKNLDRSERTGSIRIGCGVTWNAAHFHTRLSRHFTIHHPNVRLDVEGFEPKDFLSALRNKETDAVIMYSCDVERQQDIICTPLLSLGLGFLYNTSLFSLLPRKKQLKGLSTQTFLVVDSVSEKGSRFFTKLISEVCAAEGFYPQLRHCKTMSSALVDVSCGKGILLVDDWTSANSNSEFHYMPIDRSIDVCLAHLPASPGSLVNLFEEETLRVFKGNY